MFDLKGKTALLTGASGGIGMMVGEKICQAGGNVVLSGTRQVALEELAARLKDNYPNANCQAIAANLQNPEAVDNLFVDAEENAGAVNILVNCAGITRDNLAIRMSVEDWQEVIDVNLTSIFRLCRIALRAMIKRRYGRIITITSVVGVTGNPGQANYCATKAGLIGMTKSLAHEVAGRGVTVNCVAPGFIETAMTAKLNERQRAAIQVNIPIKRMGEPEDVAAAVIYLASDEAGYVTGQTIHVNGGLLMV